MNTKVLRSQLLVAVSGLAIAAAVWRAYLPDPVKVELAKVTRGPMEVTIDEDGETRAHDRYVVSAPVAGRLARVELHEGDNVRAQQAVATIYPIPLDPLAKNEVREKTLAAEAIERQAQAVVARLEAAHQQARRDRERAEVLAANGDISKQAVEKSQLAETAAAKELAAGQSQIEAASAEVRALRATMESQQAATSRPVVVISPVGGRVMRIPEKSERVMRGGESLIVLGNPEKLEIVVDVLSTEAVRVKPGAPARLINWGGPDPIRARVRLIEPSAFRKVSALGVEEQRVNIVLDFVDPPGALGDGYRIESQIVVWSGGSVVKAPASALFRCGAEWCAFAVRDGRAVRQRVEIGHRNQEEVEVMRGVEVGTNVIVHPPNSLSDGAAVEVLRYR